MSGDHIPDPNFMTIEHHIALVRATIHKSPLSERELRSWQECVNAQLWTTLGNAYAARALELIRQGQISRASRSWHWAGVKPTFNLTKAEIVVSVIALAAIAAVGLVNPQPRTVAQVHAIMQATR